MAKKPIIPFEFWRWRKIGLPNELWDVLSDVCVIEGRYLSDVIARLLLKALGDKAPKVPDYRDSLEATEKEVEPQRTLRDILPQKRRQRLLQLLEKGERSRKELAEAMGVTPKTVSNILHEFCAAEIVTLCYRGNQLYAQLKDDANVSV